MTKAVSSSTARPSTALARSPSDGESTSSIRREPSGRTRGTNASRWMGGNRALRPQALDISGNVGGVVAIGDDVAVYDQREPEKREVRQGLRTGGQRIKRFADQSRVFLASERDDLIRQVDLGTNVVKKFQHPRAAHRIAVARVIGETQGQKLTEHEPVVVAVQRRVSLDGPRPAREGDEGGAGRRLGIRSTDSKSRHSGSVPSASSTWTRCSPGATAITRFVSPAISPSISTGTEAEYCTISRMVGPLPPAVLPPSTVGSSIVTPSHSII